MTNATRIRLTAAALFGLAAIVGGQIQRDPAPRWWRGNLHTHSFWSDGDQFPEMIAEWYRDHGYHFLALSDHNILSQGQRWVAAERLNKIAGVDAVAKYRERYGDHWVEQRGGEVRLKTLDEVRTLVEERGRFLMIQSEEITGTSGDGRQLHMNATNIGERLPFQSGATIRDAMVRNLQSVQESAERTGREILLHLNHPNFRWGVTAEDIAAVVNERYFEVWNGHTGTYNLGDADRASTDEIWDIANTLRLLRYQGQPLYGLGTDDTHHYQGNKTVARPGRAWVMVRARYLTPESIVRAMRAGDFYASTGVALEDVAFDRQARRLTLRIQPQAGEAFTTRFIGTRKGASIEGKPRAVPDTTLKYTGIGEVLAEVKGTEASYQMRGDELYVRAVVTSTGAVEVADSESPNKRAWTQPVGW